MPDSCSWHPDTEHLAACWLHRKHMHPICPYVQHATGSRYRSMLIDWMQHQRLKLCLHTCSAHVCCHRAPRTEPACSNCCNMTGSLATGMHISSKEQQSKDWPPAFNSQQQQE